SAASVGVYFAAAGAVRALSLPGARRRETGSYELASGKAAGVPTTSWMFDSIPPNDPAGWRLEVHHGNDQRVWTLAALGAVDDRVTAVLDCTGGWWTEQTWTGARVARLLPSGTT